jgi:hypothetical protein
MTFIPTLLGIYICCCYRLLGNRNMGQRPVGSDFLQWTRVPCSAVPDKSQTRACRLKSKRSIE